MKTISISKWAEFFQDEINSGASQSDIISHLEQFHKEKFETNKFKPSDKDLISKVKQNLKKINIDKKVTDYNFDLGYSLGFLDGNDFSSQIPELTLDQAVEKAKPNMDKIKDVDAHLNEIK